MVGHSQSSYHESDGQRFAVWLRDAHTLQIRDDRDPDRITSVALKRGCPYASYLVAGGGYAAVACSSLAI